MAESNRPAALCTSERETICMAAATREGATDHELYMTCLISGRDMEDMKVKDAQGRPIESFELCKESHDRLAELIRDKRAMFGRSLSVSGWRTEHIENWSFEAGNPENGAYLKGWDNSLKSLVGIDISSLSAPITSVAYMLRGEIVLGNRKIADVQKEWGDKLRAFRSDGSVLQNGIVIVLRQPVRNDLPDIIGKITGDLNPEIQRGMPLTIVAGYNVDNSDIHMARHQIARFKDAEGDAYVVKEVTELFKKKLEALKSQSDSPVEKQSPEEIVGRIRREIVVEEGLVGDKNMVTVRMPADEYYLLDNVHEMAEGNLELEIRFLTQKDIGYDSPVASADLCLGGTTIASACALNYLRYEHLVKAHGFSPVGSAVPNAATMSPFSLSVADPPADSPAAWVGEDKRPLAPILLKAASEPDFSAFREFCANPLYGESAKLVKFGIEKGAKDAVAGSHFNKFGKLLLTVPCGIKKGREVRMDIRLADGGAK